MKLAIDGNQTSGRYRVDCECGDNWSGQGELCFGSARCPALAIAEVVVHMKLVHDGEFFDLRFSERFRGWLSHYWELTNLHQASELLRPGQRGADMMCLLVSIGVVVWALFALLALGLARAAASADERARDLSEPP